MTKTEILKVIRAHCLDCCYDNANEVKLCACEKCALHPLRFGKDPTKRVLSPEEKVRLAERFTAKGEKTEKQQDAGESAEQEGGNT